MPNPKTIPYSPVDLDRLPDNYPLRSRQFCSCPDHPGAFPFSRSRWWELVKAGEAPEGRKLPGKEGNGHARYWTAGEVREVTAKVIGDIAA